MDLSHFLAFDLILSSDFKPWGESLWDLTYLTPFTPFQHMFASWQILCHQTYLYSWQFIYVLCMAMLPHTYASHMFILLFNLWWESIFSLFRGSATQAYKWQAQLSPQQRNARQHDCTCYGPTHWDYISMDLVNFFFSLSYLIISDFKLWGDSLWELIYLTPFTISQTCVCLMANLVSLNLTVFLTVPFHAVHGYAATHAHSSCSCFLFHSTTAMWLHHVINHHYACPR